MNDDGDIISAEDAGIAPDTQEGGEGSEAATEWVEAPDNPGGNTGGDDAGGDGAVGDAAAGDVPVSDESAGDTGEVNQEHQETQVTPQPESTEGGNQEAGQPNETVKDEGKLQADTAKQGSETSSDVGDSPYPENYVTSEQATQIYDQLVIVNTKLDALAASSVVVVVAIFACVGVMSIQTLLKSFEGRR